MMLGCHVAETHLLRHIFLMCRRNAIIATDLSYMSLVTTYLINKWQHLRLYARAI